MDSITVRGVMRKGIRCTYGVDGGPAVQCHAWSRFVVEWETDAYSDEYVRCGEHAISWLVGNVGRVGNWS